MTALSALTTHRPHSTMTDPAIRRLMVTYRHYLLHHADTRRQPVLQQDAAPFYYNLFAYLESMGYERELHYPILMLSDLESPQLFDETVHTLVVPSLAEIQAILAMRG